MKQRITYVVKDAAQGYDPSNLAITKTSLTVSALEGAKEDHITLGLHELPEELREVLTDSHELYIRWSSSQAYDASAPYVSRVSPGLHVFFSPLKNSNAPLLCEYLKAIFGQDMKCESEEDSFTTPPILSGRFSHSASRQFYSYVPTLENLVDYMVDNICPTSSGEACKAKTQELRLADYLDLDYDSISHALVLKAFWSKSHLPTGHWEETHRLSSRDGALEVGVLINEKPDESEELKYSGALTQVGKDSTPSSVLFSFPSRHHLLPSTFATSFTLPTGLHPTLKITLPAAAEPPAAHCALHTYLTLPSSLFIDRYPLNDPLFLRSHSLKALHALSGATDLEAPDYLTPAWGSAALFEIDTSAAAAVDSRVSSPAFDVTVPLHLRYLPPVANSTSGAAGIRTAQVPDPVLFWACPAEEYGKYASSPFDRVNLGYEGLFGPKTLFYHFTPAVSDAGGAAAMGGQQLVQRLKVPVLDLDQAWYVEWGTVIAVLLGAVLVGWPLVRVLVREFGRRWETFNTEQEKAQEKKKR